MDKGGFGRVVDESERELPRINRELFAHCLLKEELIKLKQVLHTLSIKRGFSNHPPSPSLLKKGLHLSLGSLPSGEGSQRSLCEL